jgi:hypothetical protein
VSGRRGRCRACSSTRDGLIADVSRHFIWALLTLKPLRWLRVSRVPEIRLTRRPHDDTACQRWTLLIAISIKVILSRPLNEFDSDVEFRAPDELTLPTEITDGAELQREIIGWVQQKTDMKAGPSLGDILDHAWLPGRVAAKDHVRPQSQAHSGPPAPIGLFVQKHAVIKAYRLFQFSCNDVRKKPQAVGDFFT